MLKPACAKGSTSPGPDGTPLGLFRRNSEVMYPLLARLLTAIMAAGGQLPAGFHDGTIIYLHKAGDRTNPANYRPITLLNTDYLGGEGGKGVVESDGKVNL